MEAHRKKNKDFFNILRPHQRHTHAQVLLGPVLYNNKNSLKDDIAFPQFKFPQLTGAKTMFSGELLAVEP